MKNALFLMPSRPFSLPPLPDFVSNGMTQLQLQFKTDRQGNGISVYPNPANEQLNISYRLADENAEATFYLYDVLGKPCVQSILAGTTGEWSIDLTNFASGMYYYQVISNGNLIASDKIAIVKTH